jgi:hypothetical protein
MPNTYQSFVWGHPEITEWEDGIDERQKNACSPSCYPLCPPLCHPSCNPAFHPGCGPSAGYVCHPFYR